MDRPAYLPEHLTDQQLAAIVHAGSPLLIIAGPGSGKTEVITWRVAHQIRSGQVKPSQCLVTTFTEKAALELKERIQQKVPEVDVAQMQVCTLHSLCGQLLRDYSSASALPRGYRVLDDSDQLLFVYTNRGALGLKDIVKGRPEDFYAGLLRAFSRFSEELVPPEQLIAWCQEKQAQAEVLAAEAAKGRSKTKAAKAADEVERWQHEALVVGAYQAYCTLLQEQGLMDFSWMLRHALGLLDEHPEIVNELRERYQTILVDEYQDTNVLQERVLRHMAGQGDHLAVVGDDDQGIYRFRGATVGNILGFEARYPHTKTVLLAQNFRSREQIVKHSQQVIVNNLARFSKDLFTQRGLGSDVLLIYEHTVAEEAAAVASLLRRLKQAGKIRHWRDVALLLRSVHSYSPDYRDALRAEGIPFYVQGDATFFERPDIQDFYTLFHFLGATKPWADMNLRCAVMGLAEETCAALQAYKGDLNDIADDAGLQQIGTQSPADRRKLQGMIALRRQVQAKEQRSFSDVFYQILSLTGYAARAECCGDTEALLNLGVLSQIVASFDEFGGTSTFYPFQDYLKLLKDASRQDALQVEPEDALRVMTIHQAKGLEFPVVVVGSAMDGRLPAQHRRDAYEVPRELCASSAPQVRDEAEDADIHLVDERRLFYVAATRAKELLILSTADVVNKRGGGPSPFLVEMFGDNLHQAADYSHARIDDVISAEKARGTTPQRMSFSQLAYFLQCPMRYKFASVYGFEVLTPDPVDFGANVHRALQAIHEQAKAGQPVMAKDVDEIVKRTWVTAHVEDAQADAQARKAAARQLKQYVKQHAATFARIERAETTFSFGFCEAVLTGKIDLIRRMESPASGYEIIDFKTGQDSPAEMGQVEMQLALYAQGAEKNLGLPVTRRVAHFLDGDHLVTYDWAPATIADARTRLENVLQQINAGAFEPRTSYCAHCSEFRAICPYAPGALEKYHEEV